MLDTVNIFSFIPCIVVIWRAAVSLEQKNVEELMVLHPQTKFGGYCRCFSACSWLRHSNMKDRGGNLQALMMEMNEETSLDYNSLAKIQEF